MVYIQLKNTHLQSPYLINKYLLNMYYTLQTKLEKITVQRGIGHSPSLSRLFIHNAQSQLYYLLI